MKRNSVWPCFVAVVVAACGVESSPAETAADEQSAICLTCGNGGGGESVEDDVINYVVQTYGYTNVEIPTGCGTTVSGGTYCNVHAIAPFGPLILVCDIGYRYEPDGTVETWFDCY